MEQVIPNGFLKPKPTAILQWSAKADQIFRHSSSPNGHLHRPSKNSLAQAIDVAAVRLKSRLDGKLVLIPRILRTMIRRLLLLLVLLAAQLLRAEFQAGAVVIDITPPKLPVLVNGGMLSRYVDKINTRVNARAIVATDGKESVVVDSCMMGRELLDEVKRAF
jgi:hypothetical protein